MKTQLLTYILLLPICIYSQTVLSGNIEPADIPAIVSNPILNINSENELNSRISSGGKLVLNDVTLIFPEDHGDIFWTLDRLEINGSKIYTNGNEMTILSREFLSNNSIIRSFQNDESSGKNGSQTNIYNLKEFTGNLTLNLNGQQGIDGANGLAGANGRGSRSRYGVDCRSRAKSGKNGSNGEDGGLGGNGGNLNILTIYDPSSFSISSISYVSRGGNGGKGGIGGRGGRAGRDSGPCRLGASSARHGTSGRNGVKGKDGKKGKIKITKFKLSDLIK